MKLKQSYIAFRKIVRKQELQHQMDKSVKFIDGPFSVNKLKGLDIESEYNKILNKSSNLSKSMRDYVIWFYNSIKKGDKTNGSQN